MKVKIKDRKIVIINQAANYLTIGFCNAFSARFSNVVLVTGSVHSQGEKLDDKVVVHYIHRWVERPVHKKVMSYIWACCRFYWLLLTKYRNHEVFFVSLPPMAYLLNLVLPHRFSMVIWDVYPDVFKINGIRESHPIYRIWSYLNRRSFRKAFRLFTIGERMADLLSVYVNRNKILVKPLWSIFTEINKFPKSENPFVLDYKLQNKFIVQYSGNIGLTHKVEVMVMLAEKMKKNPNILFQIIGRGSRVPALKKIVVEKGLPNCQFLTFQSDEMFPFSLSAADLGVVILDDIVSKGSVPSKSYNLMSYGIPSLYIASEDSQLHNYAEEYGHAKCFSENKLGDVVAFIEEISSNKSLYDQFSDLSIKAAVNFKRSNADKFVDAYLIE